MTGVRAFGQNEGSLNHVGDFTLLFSPSLPHLVDAAVFNPKLKFPFNWLEGDPEEKLVQELSRELESIELKPSKTDKRNSLTSYYGPGFFPKFAAYVEDDWNEILCFKPPFPSYESIYNVAYSEEHAECFKRRECYAAEQRLIDALRRHLKEQTLDFEDLNFDTDYPFGGLKRKRSFKGVHSIWPRNDQVRCSDD
jgi:hypothetical protein